MPLKTIIGDILETDADAMIVSAAPHSGRLSGFSRKLYKAAGYDLLMSERRGIGHLPKGKSAVTSGYGLKAKYIIHTSVPMWKNNLKGETEKLSECYRSALKCASDIGAGTAAVPLLGTGESGFPANIARRIAEKAINGFLSENNSLMAVSLVLTPDTANRLSEEYGEFRLSDEERYAAYESKFQISFKASGMSEKDYRRSRVEFYLDNRISNQEEAANEIGWNKGGLSKFKSGATRKPDRNRVISLAIYMKLDEEERLEFIHCAGYPYPVSENDRLIENKLLSGYSDFQAVSDELYDLGIDLTALSTDNSEKEK